MALAALKLRPPRAAGVHPDRAVHRQPPPGTRSPSSSRPAPAATAGSRRCSWTSSPTPAPTATTRPGVMFHGCGESLAVYKCANKKVDAHAVYTNTVPVRRLPRLRAEPDDLRHRVGHRRTRRRASAWTRWSSAAATWSARATTCSPRTPNRKRTSTTAATGWTSARGWCRTPWTAAANATARPGWTTSGPDWVTGEGTALSMIDTVPPRGHFAHSKLRLLPDGTYAADVGTAEFGNGTTTVHAQLAATALSTAAARVAVRQSDTDLIEHDTGAFGSAGTVVAGKATLAAAEELAVRIRAFAAGIRQIQASGCVLDGDAVVCEGTRVPLAELCARRRGGRRRTRRRGALGRDAAVGGVQRPRLPGGGEHRDGGAADPAERAGGRRRRGGQPAAVPRPDRRRDRAGAGRRAV